MAALALVAKADDDQPRPEEREDREEEHVGAPPRVHVLDVIDDRGGPQEAPRRHSCPTPPIARREAGFWR